MHAYRQWKQGGEAARGAREAVAPLVMSHYS